MMKSGLAAAAIALLLLFGYFYASNRANVSRSEKAKQAASEVGDTMRDTGVASLVDIRLKTKFGLDATRFLHAYYDGGRLLLYGLVPASVDQKLLVAEASQVPGVKTVDVRVEIRPDYITPLAPITGSAKNSQSESPAKTP
jgi:osmotically-inducible protein OsmY